MDLEEEFRKRTEGLNRNSAEYRSIFKEFQEKAKAEQEAQNLINRKRAMAMRIIELCRPTSKFSIPELMKHHEEHLVEIGKAAKVLHDKLDKYGLIK